ncbi:MAG: hypothetical protein P4L87_10340, partial [Formivibrio sp.]|nr:hypothetical protein [Formivibrio sp.]
MDIDEQIRLQEQILRNLKRQKAEQQAAYEARMAPIRAAREAKAAERRSAREAEQAEKAAQKEARRVARKAEKAEKAKAELAKIEQKDELQEKLEAWVDDATETLKQQFPQRNKTLNFTYTLEITTEKSDEDGDLVRRVSDTTWTEKRMGVTNVVNTIRNKITDILRLPYIVDIRLKNLRVMDVQFRELNVLLVKMYAASPLVIIDDMNLNSNLKPIGACVPLTLYSLYAKLPEHGTTNTRLKIDQLDILCDLNPLIDDEEIYEHEKEYMTAGYTCLDVQTFCERRRITMYAMDHRGNVIAKNNVDCNKHLPALCFLVANDHMYLVDDPEKRASIFRAEAATTTKYKLPKSIKTKEQKELGTVLYDPNDCEGRANRVHTQVGSVNALFMAKLREGVVCNKKLFRNEKGATSFVDEHGNFHVECPDYNDVCKIERALTRRYNSFAPRQFSSMTKLAWSFFNYLCDTDKGTGFTTGRSYTNAQVTDIFQTWFRTPARKGWFAEPGQGKLSGADLNKHYTACLGRASMGWSVFSVMDDVHSYQGEAITKGFYYVQTTDNELFSGNDWYSEERVQFGLDEFVISEANIKYVLRPSVTLPNTFFQQYINEIYALVGVHGKEAMNGIIGYLGRWKKTTRENFYTTSWDTALSELRNPNVTVELIYRKSTEARYTDLKDLVAAIDERDDLQHELAREDLIALELQYTNTAVFESNYLPVHKKIYDLSAIAMYKLRKRMGGKLVYQNCDTLVVEDGAAIEYGTEFGDARMVQVDGLRGEYHSSKL